jgi:hypothetical protein
MEIKSKFLCLKVSHWLSHCIWVVSPVYCSMANDSVASVLMVSPDGPHHQWTCDRTNGTTDGCNVVVIGSITVN